MTSVRQLLNVAGRKTEFKGQKLKIHIQPKPDVGWKNDHIWHWSRNWISVDLYHKF